MTAPPQIVQSIGIADTLLDQYVALVGGLKRYRDDPGEFRARVGEIEHIYPEIWRHLGDAATASRSAGRDLAAYDHVRQQAGHSVHTVVTDVEERRPLFADGELLPNQVVFHLDQRGVHLAREASQHLRSLWPGTAWSAGDAEPVVDLRAGARRKAWIALGVLLAGAAGLAFVKPELAAVLGILGLVLGVRVYFEVRKVQQLD